MNCPIWAILFRLKNGLSHFCRLHVDDIEALCSESCESSKDGVCDDGGSGSDNDFCTFGTDCEVDFQNNCGFVSELSPFPFTLSSYGRTVAHAVSVRVRVSVSVRVRVSVSVSVSVSVRVSVSISVSVGTFS
jgi:hypothetical protein